jgi:hypothetical protein
MYMIPEFLLIACIWGILVRVVSNVCLICSIFTLNLGIHVGWALTETYEISPIAEQHITLTFITTTGSVALP